MRIALIQLNVLDGNPAANAVKIISACRKAQTAGAELCIAPLEVLSGPGFGPFAKFPDFKLQVRKAIADIAAALADGPHLLFGVGGYGSGVLYVAKGNVMEKTSTLCFPGSIRACIFDEPDNAAPAADLLFYLHGQPFQPQGQKKLEAKLANMARNASAWVFAVNLAGAFGSYIYSGQSVAFAPSGQLVSRACAFEEDCVLVDTALPGSQSIALAYGELEAQWRALVMGTGDFARKAGANGVVLGLSGGMDSALVACIAKEALGASNVTGIRMPSRYSSGHSLDDAALLAQNLGIQTLTVPLETAFGAFETTLSPILEHFPAHANDLTFENLQARIRGVLLMAAANRSGALVLNTGNKSELMMGYCTLYGDTAGAVAVIGDILKTRVYELGRWYCGHEHAEVIPANIFTKEPSAELRPDQKDTDSLPPYDELDPVLKSLLSGDVREDSPLLPEVRKKILASRFKAKQCPPPLLVSGEPFNWA